MSSVLLLGVPGAGKSALVHRLKEWAAAGGAEQRGEAGEAAPAALATSATVGVELDHVVLEGARVALREVGGCMQSTWPAYLADADAIVFVIDRAGRSQLANACVALLDVATAPAVEGRKPLVVVLSHSDAPDALPRAELQRLLRLDDLERCARPSAVVLEASARTGQGVATLARLCARLVAPADAQAKKRAAK